MKRIYIGILLIASLVLAACGDTNTAIPDEAEALTLTPADLSAGTELSLQAPGEPFNVSNGIGFIYSIGRDGAPGRGSFTLRHFNFLAQMEELTPENSQDPIFQADQDWRLVAPLAEGADNSCLSLESVNFPGYYLRHSRSRVRLDPPSTSIDAGTFAADATWCARRALNGETFEDGRLSLESFNFPGSYMRRYDAKVWLSRNGGELPTDDANGFKDDVSWILFAP